MRYTWNIGAATADARKLLKGDNFPLITLMCYSAAIMSVISSLLGRTTHTPSICSLTARRTDMHLSPRMRRYEAMKREMRRRGWVRGSEESKKIVSTL